MKKQSKNHFFSHLVSLTFLLMTFLPYIGVAAQSANTEDVFGGAQVQQNTKAALGNPAEKDPREIAANVIHVLFGFLGLILISLILYGGYIWMTSQGQPDKIQKAKDILKNAVIGFLIIMSAYAIVIFILNTFFDPDGQPGGGGGNPHYTAGIGSLGSGILVSLYPEPNQTDVPRNTAVMVTFREPIAPETICATTTTATKCDGELIATTSVGAGFVSNIRIYYTKNGPACEKPDLEFDVGACGKMFDAKVYSTNDNKTFVFRPTEYLGSPSEYIWHTVYLTKNIKKADGQDAFRSYDGVRDTSWSFEVSNKLDLDPPQVLAGRIFPSPDDEADTRDAASLAEAASANVFLTAPFTDEGQASVASITNFTSGPHPSIGSIASISSDCAESDIRVAVSMVDGNKVFLASSSIKQLGQGVLSSDNKSVKFAVCGLFFTPSEGLSVGEYWQISIEPYRLPDRLTVGSRTYTAAAVTDQALLTFATSVSASLVANNLAALINSDSYANVEATTTGATLRLTAKKFGEEGNSIAVVSNNSAAFNTSSDYLVGGESAAVITTVKSRTDKPRNSIIQMSFSEAVSPLALVGSSSEVSSTIKIVNASSTALVNASVCYDDNQCISLVCKKPFNATSTSSGLCEGNYLPGIFSLSSQYKVLEFVSDHQCGVNGCGQNIYCLPGNANIKVEITASELNSCVGDDDCSGFNPYSKCSSLLPVGFVPSMTVPQNHCQNQASTTWPINYPQGGGFIGVMDVAFNSLDGNHDKASQGPLDKEGDTFYDENVIWGYCSAGPAKLRACSLEHVQSICGPGSQCQSAEEPGVAAQRGDNWLFSFWTSNEILSGSPKIVRLENIGIKDIGVSMIKPAVLAFNRVMSASTISSGRVINKSGASSTEHRLLNMGSFNQSPVGYWGTTEGQDDSPFDGEIDWTKVLIAHTDFDPATDYWAEAGSGINDIYQNCYKPSGGPKTGFSSGICDVDLLNPTCCNGTENNSTNCDGQLN